MKHLILIFILASTFSIQAQDVLKLKVDVVETTATEKVYNFITIDFVGFVGWQFQMEFDGTKMSFKEARNPLHPAQSTHNFHESEPGLLRSVWLDSDLQSNDYPDTTVLFQLVFDLLEPEGSPLCFRESQEHFEFIMDEGLGDFQLAEILISDDCYQGFSIFFETTSTETPVANTDVFLKDVSFTSLGTLSFTSIIDQELKLYIIDINGKELAAFDHQGYAEGRHTLQSKTVTPGMYALKAVTKDNKTQVVKMIAN